MGKPAWQGDDAEEAEANLFAVELLMPTEWVKRDWPQMKMLKGEMSSKGRIRRMADKYGVSYELMAARLVQCGFALDLA
jgi:Zn-dependent peptidase ImmA (M78 family)